MLFTKKAPQKPNNKGLQHICYVSPASKAELRSRVLQELSPQWLHLQSLSVLWASSHFQFVASTWHPSPTISLSHPYCPVSAMAARPCCTPLCFSSTWESEVGSNHQAFTQDQEVEPKGNWSWRRPKNCVYSRRWGRAACIHQLPVQFQQRWKCSWTHSFLSHLYNSLGS